MNAAEQQYRSGEARADLFAAAGGFLYGVLLLWFSPELRGVAIAFIAFAAYWVWRAVRAWRKPYVQLSSKCLVVFERDRPKHYVELAAIESVRQGFNRTILLMRGGMKISISHLGFMFNEDARHFKQSLAERFARRGDYASGPNAGTI